MSVRSKQLARRFWLASAIGLGLLWKGQPSTAQLIPQPAPPQPVPPQPVPPQSVPPQPVPSQPVSSQPVLSQPVSSQLVPQPVFSQPVLPQPVFSQLAPQPVFSQPVLPQPVPSQLVPQPVFSSHSASGSFSVSQPVSSQPVSPQSVSSQPVSPQSVSQWPTVAELSDVSTDDWAFQALQRLIEEYGCIQGDPNKAYRGAQSLSRLEYAAALDACLTYVLERGDLNISPNNLAILQRLQTEFEDELRMQSDSLEALENQVAQLEAQSFSNTTQLRGEVIFALVKAFGGNQVGDPDTPVDQSLVSGYRARLTFDTSLNGEDRLRIRLQGRDLSELDQTTGTPMANLGFDGADGGNVEITDIAYQVPIGKQLMASISATGAGLGDYVPVVNPLFSSSSSGSISNIGRENPIIRQGSGTGFGLSYNITNNLNVAVGHIANQASDPSGGLFGDHRSAIAQITYAPVKTMTLGATYVNSSNNVDTGTGSDLANDPFQGLSDQVVANAWGLETAIQISPQVTLGGRIGLINATARDLAESPSATIWTWSALLGLSDVGGEGSLLGIVIGQPPKLTQHSLGSQFVDPATSLHLETFYRWQVNDALSVTPGIMFITNPNHDDSNTDLAVVTLRTTLQF